MDKLGGHVSEVILVVVLLLLIGVVRVYHGANALIFVWKGEYSYHDTLVDLPKYLAMPREELEKKHADVLAQLEEMYLVIPQDGLTRAEIKQIHARMFRTRQPAKEAK